MFTTKESVSLECVGHPDGISYGRIKLEGRGELWLCKMQGMERPQKMKGLLPHKHFSKVES